MKKEDIIHFTNFIEEKFSGKTWKSITIIVTITGGAIGCMTSYCDSANNIKEIVDPLIRRKYNFILNPFGRLYNETIEEKTKRFNKVELKILPDYSISERFWWDEAKERKDKVNAAEGFHYWLNEHLMQRLISYQEEHSLLKLILNEDGDFDYSTDTWDTGIFSFIIVNGTVQSELLLEKEGLQRVLPMPLIPSTIAALLEHHQITNEELKPEWEPWNKLIIYSANNKSIPDEREGEHVSYSLMAIN